MNEQDLMTEVKMVDRLHDIALWLLSRQQTPKVRGSLKRIKIKLNYIMSVM